VRWRAGTPQVYGGQQDENCRHPHNDQAFSFHFPENLSAMNPAISCGNRIIPTATTRAAQSNTFPISRPRIEHCLARCCCQNPTSKTTERPKSHGRSGVKKALAAPAPRAAANPSGSQQLIVATELRIAASDAEMPAPCFKTSSPRGPRRRRDAPSQSGRPTCFDPGYNRQLNAKLCAFRVSPATSLPLTRMVGDPRNLSSLAIASSRTRTSWTSVTKPSTAKTSLTILTAAG
jgi:hypothetical protein